AFMGLALAWFLSRFAGGRTTAPAIIAMVVAGFFKHTLAAMPLTALRWIAETDRRLAFRTTLLGATAVAVGFALCWLAYGAVFFEQMLLPRTIMPQLAYLTLDRLYWLVPTFMIVG